MTCDFHNDIKEQVQDHEKRIGTLEQKDAANDVKIQNLIEKMDSLISWIKALIVAFIAGGGGFFVWYVQSLPR